LFFLFPLEAIMKWKFEQWWY